MELLSNPSTTATNLNQQQQMASSNNSGGGGANTATTSNANNATATNNNNSGNENSAERLLAGILDSFPSWDLNAGLMPSMNETSNNSPRNDYFFNNFFNGMDGPNLGLVGGVVGGIRVGDNNPMPMNNSICSVPGVGVGLGVGVGVGVGVGPIGSTPRNLKMSPESNNSSVHSNCCEYNDNTLRCHAHGSGSDTSIHSILSLPTPIGTSPIGGTTSNTATNNPVQQHPQHPQSSTYICDFHNEMLRYVCDYCKKLVCQCCTLHDHKEHNYASVQSFVEDSKEKIESALDSSRTGTKCIKGSIDKALAFIRLIERNCAELSDSIRKAFRQFVIAIEDRERFLLEFVEKSRQRRLTTLHDQMAGLKSALAGLSETSEMLHKVSSNSMRMDHIEIAMKITNGQRQLEQFAAIYKDLQPKHEMFAFVAPDYSLLQDIRAQGAVVLVDEKNVPIVSSGGGGVGAGVVAGANIIGGGGGVVALCNNPGINDGGIIGGLQMGPNSNMAVGMAPINSRRPLLRDNSFRIPSPILQSRVGSACGMPNPGIESWEIGVMRTSPGLHFGAPRSTQAIPGSKEHVKAVKSNVVSLSFAQEGHEDGQVSRPWGLCVDKMGNILVSDRRNNRIQVFNSDGNLKFKFGRKGVGNGEFDLPAGICVDTDNRIIVVDKDNHRVQVFTSSGVFLTKFGSYGKEYGQFQYPWDVAVNSRRQIVVTDSRNHRIQQFDSEGRFIRQIIFDNHGQNKGIASPRGVCYTPTGNIIVSDFDNHCLYLIDPDINEILSAKGHEGSGFQEFNRPSGLCCDDDGRIIVADSKNQRIIVFTPNLEQLWEIEIRPSVNPLMPPSLDEKDRTCDVALMPDGRIVFLIELSPDSKEGSNPNKWFVHIF